MDYKFGEYIKKRETEYLKIKTQNNDWIRISDANNYYNDFVKSNLHIVGRSSRKSIPDPPKPPLSRVINNTVGHFCDNCGSTMPRVGFLRLFGKRSCDNKECKNSIK